MELLNIGRNNIFREYFPNQDESKPKSRAGVSSGRTCPNIKLQRGGNLEPFVLVKDIPTVIEGDDEYAVRRMTPKECFRLMGFDDADFELLVENGISNTQLYKMAGNSISVNMLEFLFCQIFDSNNEIWV